MKIPSLPRSESPDLANPPPPVHPKSSQIGVGFRGFLRVPLCPSVVKGFWFFPDHPIQGALRAPPSPSRSIRIPKRLHDSTPGIYPFHPRHLFRLLLLLLWHRHSCLCSYPSIRIPKHLHYPSQGIHPFTPSISMAGIKL